jgi:hypothetical protein
MSFNNTISGIAEYVNIKDYTPLLKQLYASVHDDSRHNTFGKTPFVSYSLEDSKTGKPTGYEQVFDAILSEHRQVHPDYQFRSTGFNTANSVEKDVFPHTDVDFDTEHTGHYNLVIPVLGASRIDYFETREDEVYLPEKNAHGFAYYHEFKAQSQMGQGTPEFEKFLADRKIGHIIVDRPLLLDTNTMHRVVITQAPRSSFVTRWNNIPPIDFHSFKKRVESILCEEN